MGYDGPPTGWAWWQRAATRATRLCPECGRWPCRAWLTGGTRDDIEKAWAWGMSRPQWTPRDEQERADLARLAVLAEQRDKLQEDVYELATRLMVERKIPSAVVADRAGVSPSTLYRRIGRPAGI